MKKHKFNLATFNVNGLRARLHIVLPWLQENDIDCLCLQETKVQDSDFPAGAFSSIGMNLAFKGQKAYNGVAVVSPHDIDNVAYGFGDSMDEPDDPARLLTCRIQGIDIINAYVPQGRAVDHPNFQKKLAWFKRLRTLLETRYQYSLKLVCCGDMNVAPEPIDVYAPEKKLNHVCFHEAVRKAFKDCLGWGLSDCFRLLHPDEPDQYTFYDYRIPRAIERRLGWRIDHILATDALCQNLRECSIDIRPRKMQKPSDHTFLKAEFSLKG